MAVTARRSIQIEFSGDVTAQLPFSAAENVLSPALVTIYKLTTGNNFITPPPVVGLVRTGVTIIPPAGNITVIRVLGDPADVGFPLHKTDPSSLGLDVTTPILELILKVSADIQGVRIIWT